jgi:hypothetical protein
MVEIRGWLILPAEFDGIEGAGDDLTWSAFFDQVVVINDGEIANISPIVQNAMLGISIFDFSNHAGKKLEKLRTILSFLERVAPEAQAHIVFTDHETETIETFELGAPYRWL